MNIIILEDEPTVTHQVETLIQQLPFPIHIQAKLTTVQGAIRWLTNQPAPDLILADILLQDGISIEIFDNLQLQTPVIYFTNYRNYVLEAFNSHVIDYILKPITIQNLTSSLDKFAKRIHFINSTATQVKQIDYLSVSENNSLLKIPFVSIQYIYLKQELTILQTTKNAYRIPQTLDELEQMLDPIAFYRANRQFIVQRQSIVRIEHLPARKVGIWLSTELAEPVVVSKAKSSNFLRWSGFK